MLCSIANGMCRTLFLSPVVVLMPRFTPLFYIKAQSRIGCMRSSIVVISGSGVGFLRRRLLRQVLFRLDSLLPDIIIPIPLHEKRMCSRGFNQAQVLVLRVGAILGRPVLANGLVRKVDTRSQVSATAAAFCQCA